MNLQPASLADYSALLEKMRAFYAWEELPFQEDYHGRTLKRLLREPQWGRVWWLELDGARVGYLILCLSYSIEFGGVTGCIDEIYLDENYRGKGLGRKALELLEEECRKIQVGILYLEASHDNVEAQKLYRKLGYTDQNRFLLTKRLPWDGKS
jgi:ribosomal protein S18 acetylase RimI-like enzyme